VKKGRSLIAHGAMAHIGARILGLIAPLSIPAAIGASVALSIPFSVCLGSAAVAVTVAFCVAFATADADLRILSLGRHKPSDYDGKTALIVGASSGIGAALAVYLAKQGAEVVLSSRGKEQLQVCAHLLL
jgi:NADPH:quinone reductase-like Zn-dependent oxidoreductase